MERSLVLQAFWWEENSLQVGLTGKISPVLHQPWSFAHDGVIEPLAA